MVTPNEPTNRPETPSYGDQRRTWHPAFVAYMHAIVEHPTYTGMPCTVDSEGKIDWTIPSNRARGSKNWTGNSLRREWWRAKARSLGISQTGSWLSKVARYIHPTKAKPCQTCGRMMSIEYCYPRRNTIALLNELLPTDEQLAWEDFLTVDEIVDHFVDVHGGEEVGVRLAEVFTGLTSAMTAPEAKRFIHDSFVAREARTILSPGVMSNAPDRLDGFHTYNLCCRSREDTGRATDNMKSYGDDRRAFEQWCEGDWAAANVLMKSTAMGHCAAGQDCISGPQAAVQLTADHIGPISLGFRHSPSFRPLCGPCNSARNRRMTATDVKLLIDMEAAGPVASWQARFLWDRCKHLVRNDQDAARLSTLMRVSQHHFLLALHEILSAGAPEALLRLLNPALAEDKIDFEGLDRATLRFTRIVRRQRCSGYARSKAARMVRIAYDALIEYASKTKRNIQVIDPMTVRGARNAFQHALARAVGDPSSWRDKLSTILSAPLTPDERANRLASLFAGEYLPDRQYEYLHEALAGLMDAYAGILARRFAAGETVAWDDDIDGVTDLIR